MKVILLIFVLILAQMIACQDSSMVPDTKIPIIFTTFISDPDQLDRIYLLGNSIRNFGGKYKDAPIWACYPEGYKPQDEEGLKKLASVNVELKSFKAPPEAWWYFLTGMVYTAASMEAEAEGKAAILVMLGGDSMVLQQPDEFILSDGKNLAYCPVMHKNISPIYSEPLDEYWSRAYTNMDIKENSIFPIITPADGDTIRPYFNAGCLAVHPERGIFRKWAENFALLYNDEEIKAYCEKDTRKRIFTFQVALTGAILNNLTRDEMVELSNRYNYPIFFKEMYGAKRDFHDITDVVTIRSEDFFSNPIDDWDKILKGPEDRIVWIKEQLATLKK